MPPEQKFHEKRDRVWRHFGVATLVCLLAVLWSVAGHPQAAKIKTASKARTGDDEGELQLARAKTNPMQFLRRMREGADLHYHLNGGRYAETMFRNN